MKRKLLVAVPLLCLVVLLAWSFRPKHESVGVAYISERSVTLFSSMAQVREQVGVLYYGERVEVLAHRNDNAKVRTAGGVEGWVDSRYLMDPALWQRCEKLLRTSKGMVVQARGRTKTTTNLRIAPGRTEPRLYQFNRGTEVEIFGRAVADWVQVSDEERSDGRRAKQKRGLVSGAGHRYAAARGRRDSKFGGHDHDAAGRSDGADRGLGGGAIHFARPAGSGAAKVRVRRMYGRWRGLS